MSGTLGAVALWVVNELDVIHLPGQGAAFVCAGVAFVVDITVSVLVSLMTSLEPASELGGLVFSETPKERRTDPAASRLLWHRAPAKLAGISSLLVTALNVIFR
ncbi:hypothetical protein [Nonomuraea sp. NPDC003201]